MKVSEYIRRKNAIIEKATGLTLVPEDQIIDMEPVELSVDWDNDACPYCMTFISCEGCPMEEASNNCENSDSSYMEVIESIGIGVTHHASPVHLELEALIEEYNKSNGF